MSTLDQLLARRDLLRGRWSAEAQRPPAIRPQAIRPPGAEAPGRFETLCDGCGACAKACPAQAIEMTGAATPAAPRTPRLIAENAPCVMCDGMPCAPACPTGALRAVTPATMRIAAVVFRADACLARAGIDPGCDYCFDRCPLRGDAVTYRRGWGPAFNASRCTGCGSCVYYCPANPKALSLSPA